jgi:tripartite-type tricarboxylate transporter receptor subunit TctC
MIRGNAMMLPRRRFLSLAAGAVAAPAVSRIALAQAYPSRPITMVVPYGGGGPADGVARPLAERMAAALGQPIVIENIGGESGTTGVTRAVRAAADGYTLSFGHHGSHVVNGAIFPLPFDLRSDLEPVALLPSNPLLISARKDLPAATLKDLIAWMKDNPGKAKTASAGAGSGTYVNAVYFQNAAGVSFEFVPHQSVQTSIRALIAGELDVLFDQASNSLPHLRAGRIKALAVTSSTRTQSAPEVSTTDEAGLPGFHSATWYGLWAPKGTPKEMIATLNRAALEALADPAVAKRYAEQGLDMPSRDRQSPEAFGAYHKAEIDKWWPIIKAAGIKGG